MNQSRGENDNRPNGHDDSPLQAAMYMADLIRKYITQAEKAEQLSASSPSASAPSNLKNKEELSFRFPGPPGLVEGAATGLVVLGFLTPVRSLLVKRFFSTPRGGGSSSNNDSLGFLPDFILTSTQMLLSAHAALYVGSLCGSHYYLHQLAAISNHDPSPTADSICQDALVTRLLQLQHQGQLILPSAPSLAPTKSNANVVSSSSSSSNGTMMTNPNQRVLLEFQKALDTCRARNSLQQEKNRTDWN
jgi:hypothetical protein